MFLFLTAKHALLGLSVSSKIILSNRGDLQFFLIWLLLYRDVLFIKLLEFRRIRPNASLEEQ